MTISDTFEALEFRLKTILPDEYQECYNDIEPVSMGSAGLKYGDDGLVAWDEMWATFCDLALAGGPPHKGKLLEPGTGSDQAVVAEICRGITLVTELKAEPSPDAGWVRVDCEDAPSAEWMLRAITVENVAVRQEGTMIELPAGPAYRLEKEIKNVITVIAKTWHYWFYHTWPPQQRAIGKLFTEMSATTPLVQPAEADGRYLAEAIQSTTGLRPSPIHYAGWLGIECPSVRAAIWIMRAIVASNGLARREESVLFVPLNATADPQGAITANLFTRIHGLAREQGIL